MRIRLFSPFLCLFGMLITQGCVAAAIGYAGYAISSSKEGAAQKEAEARNIQTYNTYKADANKLNLDRQKSGLKPEPVMTFAEWKLAHNIPTPVPEPAAPPSSSPPQEKKE
jgi:hypothetical protein